MVEFGGNYFLKNLIYKNTGSASLQILENLIRKNYQPIKELNNFADSPRFLCILVFCT